MGQKSSLFDPQVEKINFYFFLVKLVLFNPLAAKFFLVVLQTKFMLDRTQKKWNM